MLDLPDIGLVIVGWLLGTLSPGIVEAIARTKRKKQLFASLAQEAHELRYKLALVAHRVRGKYGTMDHATLQLIKAIILSYTGFEPDSDLAANYRKLLEYGEDKILQAFRSREQTRTSIWPVPYAAPLLAVHLTDLSSFGPAKERLFLRVQSEIDLYNEQVDFVRGLHSRTFESSLSAENRAITVDSIVAATKTLGERAEIIVKTINRLLDSSGRGT
jgi:hypothetical protein